MRRQLVRRHLMQRWRSTEGQKLRSELISALRGGNPIPFGRLAAFTIAPPDAPPGLDLRCIDLSGLDLDEADLSQARLQGANLARTSLKRAILAEANLRGALLRKTNLSNADLQGVDLDAAVMEDVNLDGANLSRVRITDSTILADATELPPNVTRSGSSPWVPDTLNAPSMGRKQR
jgi:Pentapeptide repeats (8 copies)